MKTRVYLEVIKSNRFEGYVYKSELPEYIQMLFPQSVDTVNIEGDYSVVFDDGMPVPIIDGDIVIYDGPFHAQLNSDIFDYAKLEEELYQDGPHGTWDDYNKYGEKL